MKMPDLENVERHLRADLQRAREAFDAATFSFAALAQSARGGATISDGIKPTELSSQVRRQAAENLRTALARWNDFILKGRVPDDLTLS